jgi:hypothetical protein
MEQADATTLLERIEKRLEAVGISERAASLKAFGNPGGIRNVRHGQSKAPTIEFFSKLAPVLGVEPSWLAFGAEGTSMAAPVVAGVAAQTITEGGKQMVAAMTLKAPKIVGEVAAGHWRDVGDEVDAPSYEAVDLPLTVGYPAEAQFGLVVRGASINRVALDGDVLTCVQAKAINYKPKAGDLVIAERRRYSRSQIETTAKRLHKGENGGFELHPDSDDPRHQTKIPLGTDDGDETVEVEVVGLVTFVVRRMRQSADQSI